MSKAQRLSYFIKHELLRSFSPVYFAINMGTGIVSILFDIFPYGQSLSMKILSLIIYFLNIFLLFTFILWGLARFYVYPHDWTAIMKHPVFSLYWGCFPMGAVTIINVSVTVVHDYLAFGGKGFLYFIWAMWWLDVLISALCLWGTVHYMITSQTHSMELMTSVWLLPVVTLIVASSSGAIVANALQPYSHIHALITVTVASFIVIIGISLSLMILTIYLQRLILHGLPAGVTVMSVFLPLGPTGQSGYAFALIGRDFKSLLPVPTSPAPFLNWPYSGQTLYMICTCASFLQWTLASLWILFAIIAIPSALRKSRIPFVPTFWGLVFPNGVYASLTITLGQAFNSAFFRIYGAAYAAGTLILWFSISCRSLVYMYDVVFNTPILTDSRSETQTLDQAAATDLANEPLTSSLEPKV